MLQKSKKLLPLIILAATGAAHAENDAGTAISFGTMQVEADDYGALSSQKILTSVDILERSHIENRQVENTWELFSLLPGTSLTNYNQGALTGEFSIRAFNAEGAINAIRLNIDGIPANTHSGNMEYMDLAPSIDIQSIELVRGTNDPRYGLNNIAGNANIATHIGGNYKKVQLSAGSFDTHNLQAAAGFDDGEFAQNYALAYQESSGYRDNSDFEKYNFSGKWFLTPDTANYSIGLIARWFESDGNQPGYLLETDARNSPRTSYAFNRGDYTKYKMGSLSAHLDFDLADNLFWTFKTYVNTFEKDRLLQWISTSSKQNRLEDEEHYGAILTLTYRMNDRVTVEGGVDIQHQENHHERRLSGLRDQKFDLTNYGVFMQSVLSPTPWLKLVPGVRVDTIKGDFTDRLNDTSRDINDYTAIWQPKFSAVLTPVEGYNVYANWGRTFQTGVGAGAYHTVDNPALEPSMNDGWEVGVKFKPTTNFEGRIAYWEQTADDEIRRTFDGTGDGENIGETQRKGFDIQANWQVTEPLTVWGSYSWQEAIIENPGLNPTLASTKGKEIDHTPSFLISAGANYQIMPALSTSLTTYAQGGYYLERTNTQGEIDDYYLVDLAFDYTVSEQTNLNLQIKNLTDQYHEYAWWWGGTVGSLHTPGDRRAVYGTISYSFD